MIMKMFIITLCIMIMLNNLHDAHEDVEIDVEVAEEEPRVD